MCSVLVVQGWLIVGVGVCLFASWWRIVVVWWWQIVNFRACVLVNWRGSRDVGFGTTTINLIAIWLPIYLIKA